MYRRPYTRETTSEGTTGGIPGQKYGTGRERWSGEGNNSDLPHIESGLTTNFKSYLIDIWNRWIGGDISRHDAPSFIIHYHNNMITEVIADGVFRFGRQDALMLWLWAIACGSIPLVEGYGEGPNAAMFALWLARYPINKRNLAGTESSVLSLLLKTKRPRCPTVPCYQFPNPTSPEFEYIGQVPSLYSLDAEFATQISKIGYRVMPSRICSTYSGRDGNQATPALSIVRQDLPTPGAVPPRFPNPRQPSLHRVPASIQLG